jgi:hypothetical protein
MSLGKWKCSCGTTFIGYEEDGCPSDDDAKHILKAQKPNADDYAEMWSDDLENANRHDMTEIPSQILGILEKSIKVLKIMKSFYESSLGV